MSARSHAGLIDNGGIHRVVRGRHGDFLYNHHDVYIGRSMEKYGEFSEQEVDLFRQICRPGDVVIEVGSNIGAHTVPLAQMVGTGGMVVACEPQATVFQVLCGNIALNNLTNVHTRHVAVGDAEGQIVVPNIDYRRENNFGGLGLEDHHRGYNVPLITLDGSAEVPRLRLLKIDVEGMESQVIRGAEQLVQRYRPAIYVENDRIDRSPPLIEQLQAFEYKLFWHLPPLFNPVNFAGDPENIFGNVVSVNMLCVPSENASQINGLKQVSDPNEHPMRRD